MTTTAQEQFTELAKTRLLQKKTTITALALHIGFARNTVSRTINHPTIHPKVKMAVAKALKIKI